MNQVNSKRIKVITENDDTTLSDIGNHWVVGPSAKADVEANVKCLLHCTRAGWVLTPLQPLTVDGRKVEVNSPVVLPAKAEVRSGSAKLTLQTI